MYELTIKKDEERAVTYDVCDKDQVNDIYCRGEVTFAPPDFYFEEGTKYKINVYRLDHMHIRQIKVIANLLCSIVEHNGERIRSEPPLHKKLPEEPKMREDLSENIGKRQSARVSRSRTNAGSIAVGKRKVNPVVFASQQQLNSISVPATPIEELFLERTAVYPRQTSLDSDKIKNDEMLQHLVSSLGEREQDKKEEEIELEEPRSVESGSCASIAEEEVEVEENQVTLTSAEGQLLAEEFRAYNRLNDFKRRNTDGSIPNTQDPSSSREQSGARGMRNFLNE